ncbi:hypothetical protein J0910_17875 [Nocardiopsis sp. CNT-189]|uniref:hypothetical protein n=1 Tax=Nocardiopsis oceanisediminis TaxID=2816862 RepID=UPI003B316AD4
MASFIVGVLSSLMASLVAVAATWMLSRHVRRVGVRLLARAVGVGIDRFYPHQREAEADVVEEVSCARWLKVAAGRGSEFTRGTLARAWQGGRLESVRFLLPDPDGGRGSWLYRRESAVRRSDPGLYEGMLAEQVRTNAHYLTELGEEQGDVQIRFYELPNMFRIVLTDRTAFITFYQEEEHGRDSPCIRAPFPGALYEFARDFFAAAWEAGRPPSA